MQSPTFLPIGISRKCYKSKICLLLFVGHISNCTSDHEDRQTAISTDELQHKLSSVLHGATGCGFWDREGFHESSHAVTPCCSYTKEWCSMFGPHWFLMNHRCCFDFMRSLVWAVEWIFTLKKSQRLGEAGVGAVCFWGSSIKWGLLHQQVVSPCTRLFWWHMARDSGVTQTLTEPWS